MFENQLRDHPDAAADTLDRYVFIFEIGGRMNRRRRDHGAVELVRQAGDENQIEPARHRAECGTIGRAGIKLRLARRQSR